MTGPTMPYDAFTGDTIHQFFQMFQQMDCAIDKEHVSRENPTGCLHDLQSTVTTTCATPLAGTPHDTGQTMAFFNVLEEDAPILNGLADKYTMSDNYHQPVMGGTGPDSIPLGFADQLFFSDGNGNPVTPVASRIYNPDPQPGTLNLYTLRAQWFNCSDPRIQPGVQPIVDYLNKPMTCRRIAIPTTSIPPSMSTRHSTRTARRPTPPTTFRPRRCAALATR
jgi:phospholipase C